MKVWVSSPMILPLKGSIAELEGEAPTLRALLTHLSDTMEGNASLLDPKSKNLHSVFAVHLNGELHRFLHDGLETRLHGGDRVLIALSMFGGA